MYRLHQFLHLTDQPFITPLSLPFLSLGFVLPLLLPLLAQPSHLPPLFKIPLLPPPPPPPPPLLLLPLPFPPLPSVDFSKAGSGVVDPKPLSVNLPLPSPPIPKEIFGPKIIPFAMFSGIILLSPSSPALNAFPLPEYTVIPIGICWLFEKERGITKDG